MKLLSHVLFACGVVLAPTSARAHAFLDHAVPAVGGTVSGSPAEVTLEFTQQVVVALCNIRIVSSSGTVVAGKAVGDGSTSAVLHVRLARTLPPGIYTVAWRVVSIDTHPTSGSFRFTVAP